MTETVPYDNDKSVDDKSQELRPHNHFNPSPQNTTIEDPEDSSKVDFEIPDGGYGWVVVASIFWLNACAWGGISGFAVVLAHYIQNDVFEGGSKLSYSVISGLCFGSGLVFAPLIVYFVGIASVNISVFIGGALQFVSLMCASYASKIYQVYLSSGLLSGIALALIACYTPSVVPQWFSKKRSFAMGLCACGSGVGGIIFNLVIQKIIDDKSVQWALRAQAIIVFTIITICSLLLKTRGNVINPELTLYDKKVATSFPFWMQIVWCLFTLLSYVTVQYVIADNAISMGYSADQGSITSALMAVGVVVGRPTLGFLSDKYGAITVGSINYSVCGLLCLAMWLPAENLATLYAFSLIIGGLMGLIWGAMGAIIPRIVGLRKSSVAFGMTWTFVGMVGIVSPIIGLALKKDKVDSKQYEWVSVFSGICFFCASASLVVLRGYIIARDKIGARLEDSSSPIYQDSDRELSIIVPPSETIINLFLLRPSTKV